MLQSKNPTPATQNPMAYSGYLISPKVIKTVPKISIARAA